VETAERGGRIGNTWTPATAHKTRTAPSSTRRARSTSIVKSTWPVRYSEKRVGQPIGDQVLPGVSIMLIANFSLFPSFGFVASQSQKVAALWIVIPFSRSRSMLSIFAPTESRPRTYDVMFITATNNGQIPATGRSARTETTRVPRSHCVSGIQGQLACSAKDLLVFSHLITGVFGKYDANLMNFSYATRVKQYPLREGRLPRINVSRNADIPLELQTRKIFFRQDMLRWWWRIFYLGSNRNGFRLQSGSCRCSSPAAR
jgi:hypothetical protein